MIRGERGELPLSWAGGDQTCERVGPERVSSYHCCCVSHTCPYTHPGRPLPMPASRTRLSVTFRRPYNFSRPPLLTYKAGLRRWLGRFHKEKKVKHPG